jgi:phage protein U
MLASLGPVSFNLTNDLQSISQKETSSWAKHDVIGTGPVYEDTGDGEGTLTLKGTLHPYIFRGALSALAALRALRAAKQPVTLMRGDYMPYGWYVINEISSEHNTLHPVSGVGQEVDFTAELLAVGNPGIGGAEALLRFFL